VKIYVFKIKYGVDSSDGDYIESAYEYLRCKESGKAMMIMIEKYKNNNHIIEIDLIGWDDYRFVDYDKPIMDEEHIIRRVRKHRYIKPLKFFNFRRKLFDFDYKRM